MSATLVNARSGQVLATAVAFAVSRASRRQGLLRRDGLAPSSRLLLTPCFAVHTAFMRFAIDVIFIDRAGAVTRVIRRLRPWRIAGSWRAHATIELGAGALGTRDVIVGDRLLLISGQPHPGLGSALW